MSTNNRRDAGCYMKVGDKYVDVTDRVNRVFEERKNAFAEVTVRLVLLYAVITLVAFYLTGCGNYKYCVSSAEFNKNEENYSFSEGRVKR